MVKKVKVEKEKLKTCLTCPICNSLFDRATTISECLHTFCRKCIQDKITKEDLDTCPVCNTSLGCSPLEKLRPDNSLQDLRLKLFPQKRKNVEAATETTAAPLTASKQKEKSLSLLVANSPIVSLPKSNATTTIKSMPTREKDCVPSESDGPAVQKPVKTVENVPRIQRTFRASPKRRAGRRRLKPSPEKNDVCLESDMHIQEEPHRIAENDPNIRSSSKILSDIAEDCGKNSTAVLPEGDMQKKNTEEDTERFPEISDLWKPLSRLAEVAGQSKTSKSNEQDNIGISDPHNPLRRLAEVAGQSNNGKSNEQESIGISEPHNAHKDDAQIANTVEIDLNFVKKNASEQIANARKDDTQIADTEELDRNSMRNNAPEQIIVEPVVPPTPSGHVDGYCVPNPDGIATKASGDNPKESRDENRSSPPLLRSRRRRKVLGVRQKKAGVSEMQVTSHNATNVEANGKVEGRNVPVWFSLIASENQCTNAPLPQISSCYLRVKDSSLPVSYIKKYLVKKLSLASEAEVEIMVRGQPLLPSLRLQSLVEWWVQTTPSSEKISASVGNSGRDFVMVLSYARKSRL